MKTEWVETSINQSIMIKGGRSSDCPILRIYGDLLIVSTSNGNASETKANESFDNGVFFDIEAKRTPSIVSKLFSKRSEHIR